ncbi:MAG: cupredoxin domain-containing protein [Thermomicrobiales bacterium]
MLSHGNNPRHISGLLIALLLASGGAGLVQHSTPASAATTHPANIYHGTCNALGDIRFPLTGVSATSIPGNMATPDAMSTPITTGTANHEETSSTVIEAPLNDLSQGGNAIAIQESNANPTNIIACGDITGPIAPAANDNQGRFIQIALHERNNSGYSGVGYLRETSGGTNVEIDLSAPGTNGTQESATPVQNQGQTAFKVDIKNFAYSPSTITIPVGGTITWTNNDSTFHTVTAQDRKVLQSGTMKPSASYTQTFKTAGTYEYFCEFHANMKGTIVVK